MSKMMSREYLKNIKQTALKRGDLKEVTRINKIARFNGVPF